MNDSEDKLIDQIRDGEIPGLVIDPYNPAMAYDSMPLDTPTGAKVLFTGHGGYDHHKTHALRHLVPGQFYRVVGICVGSMTSTVLLAEVPGEWFNTVMFARPLPHHMPKA